MFAEALSSFIPWRRSIDYGPLSDFWYNPILGTTPSGITVKPDTALSLSTCYTCIRLLSEAVGSVNIKLMKGDIDNQEEVKNNPLWNVLYRKPNRWQTPLEWQEMGMAHLCIRGNFYSQIIEGDNGIELVPLNPDRMFPELMPDRRVKYVYKRKIGEEQVFYSGQILHVRGLSLDGVTGVSVIEFARNTIGSAIAKETHGASLFRNGGLPTFWISRPAERKFTPEARKNFRQGWRKLHGGAENAGNPPILEDGMELHELGLTNRDSQWIESLDADAVKICQYFRVPPYLAYARDSNPKANVEQMSIEFKRFTLTSWAIRWCQALDRDLISNTSDDLHAVMSMDEFERGDKKTRYEAHNIGIQGGWLLPNEARKQEGLPPIEGGDEPRFPMNMQPAGGGSDWNEQGGEPGKSEKEKKEPTKQEEDEPTAFEKRKSDRKKKAESFLPIIEDAAGRMAAVEVKTLGARAYKAGDDRQRWNAWAAEFYQTHRKYCTKVLCPVVFSWSIQNDGCMLKPEEIADTICGMNSRVFDFNTDVSELLDEWKSTRTDEINNKLKELFFKE